MGQLIFPHGNSKKKSNLKITIMKRSFFALLAAAVSGLASCQQDGTQDDAALPMNVYSFDATTEGTRVSLDHTALTYTWDGSEQVMVWYAPAASAPDYDYTLIGDPFVAESAGAKTAFSLRTEYDLSEMGYDDQNYVLMYPWPYAGTSGVSGDEVTYTIGTREGDGYVQKDVFEGIYNLMRAETTGSSLLVGRPPVTFEHLLTSLRFYVKESAEPAFDDIRITDMEILFPENVIGETKVNFRKGYVASASSRKVIVDLDAPLTPQKSYKDESGEANDESVCVGGREALHVESEHRRQCERPDSGHAERYGYGYPYRRGRTDHADARSDERQRHGVRGRTFPRSQPATRERLDARRRAAYRGFRSCRRLCARSGYHV